MFSAVHHCGSYCLSLIHKSLIQYPSCFRRQCFSMLKIQLSHAMRISSILLLFGHSVVICWKSIELTTMIGGENNGREMLCILTVHRYDNFRICFLVIWLNAYRECFVN